MGGEAFTGEQILRHGIHSPGVKYRRFRGLNEVPVGGLARRGAAAPGPGVHLLLACRPAETHGFGVVGKHQGV